MRNNWQVKKLGEVLKVQNGYAFDSKKFLTETGILLIRIRDLKNGIVTKIKYNGAYDKKFEVKAGDFLIGMDGEFSCHEWKGKTALLNQRVCRLQYFKDLEPRFLFYGINKYLKEIQDVTAYTTVKHISSKQIEEIVFSYPKSLTEQRRIVAILDKAFANIAKAKENTEKNLQNAHDVFEFYLQSVFTAPKKDWEICNVEDYIRFIDYRGKTHKKTSFGLRLITAKNVKNGFLQKTPAEFISPDDYDSWMTRGIPKIGDVLFTTEAPLAKVAQLDTNEKVAFAQRVIIMQPQSNKLNQTFLKYLLLSNPIKQNILEKGTGATVQGIKASLLKKIRIYFPSLASQCEIVAKLDALSAHTKKLIDIYQKKIANLDELKKSLLQKAFTGELT